MDFKVREMIDTYLESAVQKFLLDHSPNKEVGVSQKLVPTLTKTIPFRSLHMS